MKKSAVGESTQSYIQCDEIMYNIEIHLRLYLMVRFSSNLV